MSFSSSTLTSHIRLTAVTAVTTATLPAGYAIRAIHARANNGNAVTGGIKVGTTAGGVDIAAAIALAGSALTSSAVLVSAIAAADRTIYIDAVAAWNSASVDIVIETTRVF